MKHIVFTVIPSLTKAQQQALADLFARLESTGHTCHLWMLAGSEPPLSTYRQQVEAALARPLTLLEKIKVRFLAASMPLMVWKERYQRWRGAATLGEVSFQVKGEVFQAYKVLHRLKPDYFFCWNTMSPCFGIAAELAKTMRIPVRLIEWGYLPHSIYLDGKGAYGFSELHQVVTSALRPEVAAGYIARGADIYRGIKGLNISLYQQASIDLSFLATHQDTPKLLVLGIDETDSNVYPTQHPDRKVHLPFHADCYAMAKDIAERLPDHLIVYKPHPSRNPYKETKQHGPHFWVVNSEPNGLIEWADAVVCVGSKMELNVLLKDKPLVLFHGALLANKGCGYVVHNMEELPKVVATAKAQGVTAAQLQAFHLFLGYVHAHSLYVFQPSDGIETNLEEVVQRFLKQWLDH